MPSRNSEELVSLSAERLLHEEVSELGYLGS
jgi:hypothetical protein